MLRAVIFAIFFILSTFGTSEGLFSFFSNRDSTSNPEPKLVLTPANATLSPGVRVTLGCKANLPVKVCQWAFYSASNPEKRIDLVPFSPSSKHEKRHGRLSDQDCSYEIKDFGEKHRGQWVCSVLPHYKRKLVLMSKPAFLGVVDPHDINVTTPTPTPKPSSTASSTSVSASTTVATTIPEKEVTSETPHLVKEPRMLPSIENDRELSPYFVVNRKPDNSVNLTWILESVSDLKSCVWITPNRVRLSSSGSVSDSVWLSRDPPRCGILLEGSKKGRESLSGMWSIIAEFSEGRKLTSTINVNLREIQLQTPKSSSSNSTRILFKGWPIQNAPPMLILSLAFGAIIILLAIIIAIVLWKCCCSNSKSNPSLTDFQAKIGPSVIGISDHMPVKTYIQNPDYHPTLIEKVQERSLPSAPTNKDPTKSILKNSSQNYGFNHHGAMKDNRHSVIGIEVPSPRIESNDVTEENPDQDETSSVHYSYILPKSSRAPATYLTLMPPKRSQSMNKQLDGSYEHVSQPLPPYENTNKLEFTTFGFSSLKRERKVSFGKEEKLDGGSDSGVDSDSYKDAQII